MKDTEKCANINNATDVNILWTYNEQIVDLRNLFSSKIKNNCSVFPGTRLPRMVNVLPFLRLQYGVNKT